MRPLNTLIVVLFLCSFTTASAQINSDKRATKLSQKMKKALDLSKEETQDIYDMQYERFEKANRLKEKYADQPDVLKQKRKELGKEIYNNLKNYLGKDRLKEWRKWRKRNK
jgi:pantothenate kinase type III